ncbi:hypothetical protein FRC01_007486 [Tulasnella sp. 417]|nr:hypothetical protein FRC01_007486 [Tulasnella sp. 417]
MKNMELGHETDADMFQNMATQLETLTVRRSSFPWRSSIASNLRKIELDHPRSIFDFGEQFICVLRASPHLTALTIRFCDAALPAPISTESVNLSHLRTLEIERSPQLSSQLLLMVVCTPATVVTVTEAVGGLAIYHPVVSAALNHVPPDCKGNPSLSVEYGRKIAVKYGNVSLTLTRRDVDFEKAAQLAFCSAFFGHFTGASRATSSELQLEWSLGWDIASFLDILDADFPRISRLELVCRTYSSWTADLGPFARTLTSPYSKEGRSRWLLATLDTLSIRWPLSSSDWIDDVIEIVRSRRGAPEETVETDDLASELLQPRRLRLLCLQDCTIPSVKMNILKDLLGDGVELDAVWVANGTEGGEDYGSISIMVS